MTSNDRQRFATVLERAFAIFGVEATEAMYEGYWYALSDLDIGAVELAVTRAVSQSRFMPKPVELRELAGELPLDAQAAEAWRVAMDALQSYGYYDTVKFEDRCITATIRALGGWIRLGEMGSDELEKYERARFIDLYTGYAIGGIGEDDDRADPLMGWFDRTNLPNGGSAQKVKLIPSRVATPKRQLTDGS